MAVRCYDCAQPIPDDEIIRRRVQTGTSFGRGVRTYYHKVNLCPECAAVRDRNTAQITLVVAVLGGILLLGCVVVAVVFPFINSPRQVVVTSAKQSFLNPRKQQNESTHELSGTVTFLTESKRQIGLRHEGITGKFKAGNNSFELAPAAPWPSLQIGQKVTCTVNIKGAKATITAVTSPAE